MAGPIPPTDSHLDGQRITIRPISSADSDLEVAFIDRLSPLTKHYRFLGGIHHVSEQLLKEFCNVDFDQTAAFIATTRVDGKEREIGVARYAPCSTDNAREMAITIADGWQDKGLDVLLAKQLIDFSKSRGVQTLYSIDLADNMHMHQLADDLGMSSKHDPDDPHQVIYTLALDPTGNQSL